MTARDDMPQVEARDDVEVLSEAAAAVLGAGVQLRAYDLKAKALRAAAALYLAADAEVLYREEKARESD